MKCQLSVFYVVALLSCSEKSAPDYKIEFREVAFKSVFSGGDSLRHWGGSVIKGEDGLYHMLYSRWPKQIGWEWVTHSEIAHATSESPFDPFHFKDVALPDRGAQYWDGLCTHNPTVHKFNGKYCLYYMGTSLTAEIKQPVPDSRNRWHYRNSQRIGIAIAKVPNEPWKRFDKPLNDINENRRTVSTSVVSIRPDGKFLMAYKFVVDKEGRSGGRVIHVTAVVDSPTGPFKDTGIPFITHPTASFAINDHVEWLHDGKDYCIAKDSRGAWSDYPDGSTMLFESDETGMNWKPAKNFLVIEAGELKWTDGTVTKTERTDEMPKLYMENDMPKAFIVAVLPKESFRQQLKKYIYT